MIKTKRKKGNKQLSLKFWYAFSTEIYVDTKFVGYSKHYLNVCGKTTNI